MPYTQTQGFKAGLLSLLILGLILGIWHLATLQPAPVAAAAPA